MPRLEFVKSGLVLDCPETKTVLEAAQEAGLELAYSCQGGTCHTCAVKVEGSMDTEEMLALTPQELTQGWRLICVGRPQGDLRIEA